MLGGGLRTGQAGAKLAFALCRTTRRYTPDSEIRFVSRLRKLMRVCPTVGEVDIVQGDIEFRD